MDSIKDVAGLPVNEIKKIMVLPPGTASDFYTDPEILFPTMGLGTSLSMVVIETYSDNRYRGEPRSLINYVLDGIDTHRNFYSPQYDKSDSITKEFDGRATLYWNPSISTNSNGLAKVEFFTSDRFTELIININGFNIKNGNPGQGRVVINVE